MKIRNILNELLSKLMIEAYDDLPLSYFLNDAKRLKDYTKFSDRLEKNGFAFLHFPKNDDWYRYGEIKVFNKSDGTEIANATYGKQHEYDDMKGSMDVRSDFRRKGLATLMYDWIEDLNKEEMVPDLPHSPSAAAFWDSRFKSKHK